MAADFHVYQSRLMGSQQASFMEKKWHLTPLNKTGHFYSLFAEPLKDLNDSCLEDEFPWEKHLNWKTKHALGLLTAALDKTFDSLEACGFDKRFITQEFLLGKQYRKLCGNCSGFGVLYNDTFSIPNTEVASFELKLAQTQLEQTREQIEGNDPSAPVAGDEEACRFTPANIWKDVHNKAKALVQELKPLVSVPKHVQEDQMEKTKKEKREERKKKKRQERAAALKYIEKCKLERMSQEPDPEIQKKAAEIMLQSRDLKTEFERMESTLTEKYIIENPQDHEEDVHKVVLARMMKRAAEAEERIRQEEADRYLELKKVQMEFPDIDTRDLEIEIKNQVRMEVPYAYSKMKPLTNKETLEANNKRLENLLLASSLKANLQGKKLIQQNCELTSLKGTIKIETGVQTEIKHRDLLGCSRPYDSAKGIVNMSERVLLENTLNTSKLLVREPSRHLPNPVMAENIVLFDYPDNHPATAQMMELESSAWYVPVDYCKTGFDSICKVFVREHNRSLNISKLPSELAHRKYVRTPNGQVWKRVFSVIPDQIDLRFSSESEEVDRLKWSYSPNFGRA